MAETININEVVNTIHPNLHLIRCPWRFNEKGELIVMNPSWSDYKAYNYKHKYGIPTACKLCNRVVVLDHMHRHQRSNICKKNRTNNSIE